jgi:hypothetical protein
MSLYQRRLDSIMEREDCSESKARELMKNEFSHDELEEEDEADRFFREYEDE